MIIHSSKIDDLELYIPNIDRGPYHNYYIILLRPDALCCPEIYRDVPGMLVMMMMIEDLQWM